MSPQLGQSSYAAPVSRSALESLISEHEHQALDLLDELPSADDSDALAAVEVVRGVLPRLVESLANTLIDAAWQLSQTEDRGSLDAGRLDEIRLTLSEQPRLSLAITPAVETTAVVLGLDRAGAAWAVLSELAEQAGTEAGTSLHACSTAIAERLAAAQSQDGQPVARALWVFRCAAVAQAGPSIRARVLAADHVEHLALARALVEQHRDAAALVDAFDTAVQALRAAKQEPPTGPDAIDGPKRKFTYVHVILAMIVLGLTLWHYVWR
jgi:hypothetical protein